MIHLIPVSNSTLLYNLNVYAFLTPEQVESAILIIFFHTEGFYVVKSLFTKEGSYGLIHDLSELINFVIERVRQ